MEESKQDCSDRDADSDRTSDIPLRECDCFRLEICAKNELFWNSGKQEGTAERCQIREGMDENSRRGDVESGDSDEGETVHNEIVECPERDESGQHWPDRSKWRKERARGDALYCERSESNHDEEYAPRHSQNG